MSLRVDSSVQSPIRKFKESNKKIKKVVAVETVSVDIEVDRFLKFAHLSHQNICNCDLFDSGESDRGRVRGMLGKTPLQMLCVAWVLFLQSDDPYIVEHYPARNIAIFKAQLRNFEFPAQSKLMGVRTRREERARGGGRPVARCMDRAQTANWEKCLYEIQAQILPENYSTLIEPLVFAGVQKGRGVIMCPSKLYRDSVAENFGDLIKSTMANVFGGSVSPQYLLDTG